MSVEMKMMRDVFIERIHHHMKENDDIFFLSADFGSPMLDRIRLDFPERFVNVGIAEQNLINICAGMALEGATVYAYAIAPFLTMRAFEQIRINISLHAQLKSLNINLVGVGAGLSYDVSGPTHHCLEDITIMRVLPHLELFSPSDWALAKNMADYSVAVKKPKYFRLDGKMAPRYYDDSASIEKGFCELVAGDTACIVSTGYMTRTALKAQSELKAEGIKAGVIDVYSFKPFDEEGFASTISKYGSLITIEEGFINRGGLDSMVATVISARNIKTRQKRMGMGESYSFEIGSRDYLHKLLGLDHVSLANNIKSMVS